MELDAIIIATGALITAVGGFIGAVALGMKNLAEGRATRIAAEHTAREVSPNHGSSLADAVSRIEARQREHSMSIGGIRDDARADRQALITSHQILDARIQALEKEKS